MARPTSATHDLQRDILSAVTRLLRLACPQRVPAANQTAVAMLERGIG